MAEFAGEFVEQLGEAADEEAGDVAQAVVVEFARLERDKSNFVETFGGRIVGRADGERGLPHPARSINERAPCARLGIECVGDFLQLVFAPEERLKRGEIVRDGSARGGIGGYDGLGVVILAMALVERETFEDRDCCRFRCFVL